MAQTKNIDIIPNNAIKRVHVSQGDIGRTIYFNLYEGSLAYTPTSGDVITCVGTKPSGLGFTVTCSWSGNVVTCVTTEGMTDEYGSIDTELVITSSDESTVLGTSNFVLVVEKNPHPDTTTDGNMETLIPELTLLVNEVKEYAEEIEGTYHAYGSPWVASTVSAMTDTTKIYVYTGSETGYSNGNWYYYDGTSWVSGGVYNSVAVETDATLSVSGMPADAEVVGGNENYAGIKNILRNTEFTHRETHTSNGITFVKLNDVEYSISGTATASTVQDFYNSETALPTSLTAGMTYLLVIKGFTSSCQLRTLFSTSSEDLTIYTEDGRYKFVVPSDATSCLLRIYVPNGATVNTTCEVGIFDINDIYSMPNVYAQLDDLNTIADDVEALNEFKGNNYANDMQWLQGGYGSITNFTSPNENSATTRIHTQVTVAKGKYIILYPNPNYQYTWATFDENGTYLEGTASWQSSVKHMDYEATYVRLAVKRSDNADILPTEGVTSGINVVSYASSPTKLKVMTYNIGRYAHGTSPYYLDSNYDTKVANLKSFFSEQICDVVGLQEANTYLDGATSGSDTANDEIYNYLYPYFVDYPENTALKSKYPLINGSNGTLSTGRPKSEAKIEIYGKEIYLLCVHLTPNAGESQETARTTERAEIIALMQAHQYAVCFGDFNAQQFADFNDFTDAGLKIANGGYMEEVNTYGGLTVFQERLPMDNIIVTPNIIIDNSERLEVFDDLVSDHIPFVAYLTIN